MASLDLQPARDHEEDPAGDHEVAGDPSPPLRLVIQGTPGIPPDVWPLRLARRMHLDGWGDFLLGRRVAYEMGTAACILLVVLLFELLAWSLLFNVLVHSARWTVSPRTFLAFLLAAIFGGGVFLFERSFITADLGERPAKKVLAYLLRLVVIFGSCVATSQPVELLVFGGAIETRLRDENALAEAVRLVDPRQKYEAAAAEKSASEIEKEGTAGTRVATDLDHYRTLRDNAAKQEIAAGNQLQGARDAVAAAARSAEIYRQRLGDARRQLQAAPADSAARADLDAAVAAADAHLQTAVRRLLSARDAQAASERASWPTRRLRAKQGRLSSERLTSNSMLRSRWPGTSRVKF